jgi:hypothetical protein
VHLNTKFYLQLAFYSLGVLYSTLSYGLVVLTQRMIVASVKQRLHVSAAHSHLQAFCFTLATIICCVRISINTCLLTL